MKKILLLIFSSLSLCHFSLGQTANYATAGTGNMRNYISWFNWAGTNVANGTVKNFTTPDGLNVTITFSNVTGPAVTPYVMNTWPGAVLWNLYNFTDPAIKPALFSQNTLSTVSFTMNIVALRNGFAVPFTIVAADAEGSDNTETTTFNSFGPSWRTIEFFRNSSQTNNPVVGCASQAVTLSNTYGGAPNTGQNPILATDGNGVLTIQTTMTRTTAGGMAVAFGIFAPIDRGDLPASYGYAQHALNFTTQNTCNYNSPFPSLKQDTSLHLGATMGDADGAESNNDNASGADEDGILSFSQYNGSGSYLLNGFIKNQTGGAQRLWAWFDWNRSGTFESSELVTILVPHNMMSFALTWTGLPANLPMGSVSDFAFRLRVHNSMTAIQSSGFSEVGEVEDYLVPAASIIPCGSQPTFDFGFEQSICSPKTVTFNTSATGMLSYEWAFGDAQTNTTSLNPSHTYANYGTYPVTLKIEYLTGCFATITKSIPVSNNFDNSIIVTADAAICAGSSTTLITTPDFLKSCWTTSTGVPVPANKVVTPTVTTTYYLNLETIGSNLVNNADFNLGNTGFTSDYVNAQPNTTEGQYRVSNNPPSWNPGLQNCPDHTGGGGNMMLVNGSPTANARIWSQTVPVIPNTNYAFSTWIQSLFPVNYANLKFAINNVIIGNNILAGNVCNWSRFSTTWNSGSATSAVITIVNNNTIAAGNDFAIDDIFFGPILMKNDSVTITVNPLPTVNARTDTTICNEDSLSLTTSATGNNTYSWSPATGLSSATVQSPVAAPAMTTEYFITATTDKNCAAIDSVTIIVNNRPTFSLGVDTGICKGDSLFLNSGYAASSYIWQDGTNNPGYMVRDTGLYHVTLTMDGCSRSDSIHIGLNPDPVINVMSDTTFCDNQLIVIQTQSAGNYNYNWFPSTGLSDPNMLTPQAIITDTIRYLLTATNSFNCRAKDSITITPKPSPVVELGTDTLLCPGQQVILNAQNPGGFYTWSNGSTAQTLAAATEGLYHVAVLKDGCTDKDSITITVKDQAFTVSPPAGAVCKDDTIRFIAAGGDSYTWYKEGSPLGLFDSAITVTGSTPAMYSVQVTENYCGFTELFSIPLLIKPAPFTNVTTSNEISCGRPRAQLTASGGRSYKWLTTTNITNDSIRDPWVNPVSDTWYKVRVTGFNGCTGVDSVFVNTGAAFNEKFYVPTAFTPNADGKNDCIKVRYAGTVTKLDFTIYDRWGSVMFHTNSLSGCWDGKFNGVLQPNAVYVYYLRAENNCGVVTDKGFVTLIH